MRDSGFAFCSRACWCSALKRLRADESWGVVRCVCSVAAVSGAVFFVWSRIKKNWGNIPIVLGVFMKLGRFRLSRGKLLTKPVNP